MDGSTGTISKNECLDNGNYGIAITGRAYAEIRDNLCTNNGTAGILFQENAGGIVDHNKLAYHPKHGIHLTDSSEAHIENNEIIENEQVGILFSDESGGVVMGNTIKNNQWGVYIKENAHPEFMNNSIYDNTKTDIEDLRYP